eukprot:TRINITY_DN75939_c0_g1_i1.p1 TRINITY_DN75939_c0_g1~~TRINITY_DN75939_c0_g1_i1.p1  ORF type:complete len:636 (-),score=103.56 TRINITY_DN75939_c0_g1_i1:27-1934(-)
MIALPPRRQQDRFAFFGILVSCLVGISCGANWGCYCQFALSGDRVLSSGEANESEPVWVCARGYRQYRCLRKTQQGSRWVLRAIPNERLTHGDYCSSARPKEACEIPRAAGFSLHHADWRALPHQVVEVTCPFSVNCSNATAYLGRACSAEGPNTTLPPERKLFISEQAFTILSSPTHQDIHYAEPFGHTVALLGSDILIVADPSYRRLWTFGRLADDIGGHWGPSPVSMPSHPASGNFIFGVGGGVDLPSLIMAGDLKDGCPLTATPEEQLSWLSAPVKVFIFSSSNDGDFGTSHMTELGAGYEDKAMFGRALAINANFAVVSSEGSSLLAAFSPEVFIFERSSGSWSLTAAQIISLYSGVASFGEIVAVGDGDDQAEGIVVVAAPSAGKTYVFERRGGSWSNGVATSTLTSPVSSPPSVSAIAVSGGFIIVGDQSQGQARLYERGGSDGAWVLRTVLELSVGQPSVGVGAHFGAAVAIEDQGFGDGVAVVGGFAGQRAVVFWRSPQTGLWGHSDNFRAELFTNYGAEPNPDGFGCSVAVSGPTVVVGSDSRRVFVFTQQLVGSIPLTQVTPFGGSGPRHQLVFDFRFLQTAVDYTLCVDLDGEGSENTFVDVGLSGVNIPPGSGVRVARAEEL